MDLDDADLPLPSWLSLLLADADRAFEVTGAATPGWPDPHPGMTSPLEAEYSRVTDVGRYRILDSRVDAWIDALGRAGCARVVEVPATRWLGDDQAPDRHVRVRRIDPVAPGGLRLLVADTQVDGERFGLDVAICNGDADDAVLVATVPVCGCDACDSGSEDLLEELDRWFLAVAVGGVVHARQGERFATRTPDGWSTTGRAHSSWLDALRPVPAGVRRWGGTPWAPA